MELDKVTLLIWDDPLDYKSPETQRQLGYNEKDKDVKLYKDTKQFNSLSEFSKIWNELKDDDNLVFCCHVNYKDFSGYFDLQNSRILDEYPIAHPSYISSGDSGKVMKNLYDKYKISQQIILYNELMKGIKYDEKNINIFTKKSVISKSVFYPKLKDSELSNYYPKIDYGLITALYKDEFEAVKKIFDFDERDIIRTEKKEYHIGYLKDDKSKKIVAAVPTSTGMIDSAIIATQMLEFFRPDFLFMSGVCGGKSDLDFGDIVIAKQIFTFQKGKLSDITNKEKHKIDLYDKSGNQIDYNHLYDEDGNQISISVEKFEVEHDSMIPLDTLVKDRIERKLDAIKNDIEQLLKEQVTPLRKSIKIILEPIACSTMVINKGGYFEDNIKSINRNTAAVEMESYGVARACQFANNGETTPIIFKSVMDNMKDKDDKAKEFAAYTSAQFLRQLFLQGIINK